MPALFKSDFFLRFAGGFALGAVALLGLRPEALTTLSTWAGAVAHVA